jgi:hypothetical protein
VGLCSLGIGAEPSPVNGRKAQRHPLPRTGLTTPPRGSPKPAEELARPSNQLSKQRFSIQLTRQCVDRQSVGVPLLDSQSILAENGEMPDKTLEGLSELVV